MFGPTEEIKPSDLIHRERALFQFRELEQIRTMPGPKFVMAHILLPHMPYVFDENGDYPDEAERARSEPERFAAQLVYTNDQIHGLVDSLLRGVPADQQPIIVYPGRRGAGAGALRRGPGLRLGALDLG